MARNFGLVVRGCAVPFGKIASFNGMHEYIKPTAFSTFLLKRPTVAIRAYEHTGRVLGVARLHTSSAGLWFEADLEDRDVAVCASIARGWNGCSVNFTVRRFKLEGPDDVQAVYAAEIDHVAVACDSAVYAPHGAVCWRSADYDDLPGWRVQAMDDAWRAARRAYREPPPYRPRPPRAAAPALVTNSASRPFRRFPNAAAEIARIEQHFRDYPVTPLPPVRAAER